MSNLFTEETLTIDIKCNFFNSNKKHSEKFVNNRLNFVDGLIWEVLNGPVDGPIIPIKGISL